MAKKSLWVLCPKVGTPTMNVPNYKKTFSFGMCVSCLQLIPILPTICIKIKN